jgi:hypothetical protein
VTTCFKLAPIGFRQTQYAHNRSENIRFYPNNIEKDLPDLWNWFVTQSMPLKTNLEKASLELYITKDVYVVGLRYAKHMLSSQCNVPNRIDVQKIDSNFIGYVIHSFPGDLLKNIDESFFRIVYSEMVKIWIVHSHKFRTFKSVDYSTEYLNIDPFALPVDTNYKIFSDQYQFFPCFDKSSTQDVEEDCEISKSLALLDLDSFDKSSTQDVEEDCEISKSLALLDLDSKVNTEKQEKGVRPKWSPIVFSRTFTEDYRFLAQPKDLDNYSLEWIRGHIQASLRSPEKLRDSNRWSIFKNKSICVVGLSCMADDISGGKPAIDENGRRFHVFVGYVTRDLKALSPERNIDLFKILYTFVSKKWYFHTKGDVDHSEYEYTFDSVISLDDSKNKIPLKINYDLTRVSIWFDSESNRDNLWEKLSTSNGSSSLCLGMSRSKDAKTGPFQNVTIADSYFSDNSEAQTISINRNDLQSYQGKLSTKEIRENFEKNNNYNSKNTPNLLQGIANFFNPPLI